MDFDVRRKPKESTFKRGVDDENTAALPGDDHSHQEHDTGGDGTPG